MRLTCWQQQGLEWLSKPAVDDGLGWEVSRHLNSNTCSSENERGGVTAGCLPPGDTLVKLIRALQNTETLQVR